MLRLFRPLVERHPRVASMYRVVRDTWPALAEPPMTPLGFKFHGNPFMASGVFEPVETRLVQRLLDDCEVVVNVGANVGYYACQALAREKHVVAFEPMPANLQFLTSNIHANGWSARAEVFPLALSDKPGIVEIFGAGTGASIVEGYSRISRAHRALVPCSTLDITLGERHADRSMLVIVDVEGAEYMFLKGATKLLSRASKPMVMMEVAIHENQPVGVKANPQLFDTFRIFWDAGFRSFAVTADLREVTRGDLVEAVERGKSLGSNNFLFVDPQKAVRVVSGG